MASTSIEDLFETLRNSYPESLPEGSWYIPVASTLIATDGGDKFAALYGYAVKQLGPNATSEARRNISRRLREVIIKTWTLVGLPRACAGYYSLLSVEAPEDAAVDAAKAENRANLSHEEILSRSSQWTKKEFAEDEDGVWQSLSKNPALAWTIKFVQYGYFLADTSVLNDIENESAILAALMAQGAKIAMYAHMKSLRRVGISASEAEAFQDVVQKVAVYQGKDPSSWHTFKEIEPLFQ